MNNHTGNASQCSESIDTLSRKLQGAYSTWWLPVITVLKRNNPQQHGLHTENFSR